MIIDWGQRPGIVGPILGPTFVWSSGGGVSGPPNFVYAGDIDLTVGVASPTTAPGVSHAYTGSITLFLGVNAPPILTSLNDDGLGIIRYLGDISNAEVELTCDGYGDLVQVDGINIFEDFGIIGPCYRENQNLRIEYQRHGLPLDEAPFEIPDRYVTYVRHYVLARALEREGPGQDLKLAAHFQARWEAGIERMKKRKEAMAFQRLQVMGGRDSVRGQKPPRPKLPPSYGTVVR